MANIHPFPADPANPQRSTIDQYENPFFLHNNDHAGLQLVTDRLSSGADFHSWKRSVRMALNVRNKLGFIDGTIPKPPDESRTSGSWSRCNDMVATWLMNSVDKKIGQSLLFMSTAESIWKNLLTRFKQDDAPRVYEIEQRLSTIQQGSMDVTQYYTELITLWEEYKNYIELPVCTCGRCECNAAILWEQMQQRSRVTKFLMGLNESYEQTRRHILMLKPIPNIEETFNMVAQDERQRAVKPVIRSDTVAFQTSDSHRSSEAPYYAGDSQDYVAAYNTFRPRGNRPLCTHCGQLGHTVNKCYRLHGFPPGYKTPQNSYNKSSFTPRGANTYTPRPSFTPAQSTQRTVANITTGSSTDNVLTSSVAPLSLSSSGSSPDMPQFTPAQIQSIIQQISAHVRVSEPTVASCSTVSEKGVMASQSSSGTLPFLSTNLRFANHTFTFQYQCLSTLYNSLPHGSWIVDSGATSHVCSDRAMFREVFPASDLTVSLPKGTRIPILHTGTVALSDSLILYDVLHVPSFFFNLVSVSALLRSNQCSAHFFLTSCYIQEFSQGLTIGKGSLKHNLYILDLIPQDISAAFTGSLSADGMLWHQRLGHPSPAKLQVLSTELSIPRCIIPSHSTCTVCPLAKQKRLSFPFNNNLSLKPFDLLHLDIWGPFAQESIEGYKYFLTIVDDCSRVTWIHLLKRKSDVITLFPEFLQRVYTQYNVRVKAIRSDNAPELRFANLIKTNGMIHYFSCAYTPEQNSVVERKHQHLLNVARALLFQSNVPLLYWSDCITTAVFLINRIPSPLLDHRTPYEVLLKRKPDYSLLRSFGCLCYVSTLQKDRNKFSPRARPCLFLGYPSGYKGYKLLDLDNNSVSISRHVVFHESVYPLKSSTSIIPDFFSHYILPNSVPYTADLDASIDHNASSSTSSSHPHAPDPIVLVPHASHSRNVPPLASEIVDTGVVDASLNMARPKRQTKAPNYLSDYHCALLQTTDPLPSSHTTPYPLSSVLSYHKLRQPFISFLLSYSLETEPKTFKQAMASDE